MCRRNKSSFCNNAVLLQANAAQPAGDVTWLQHLLSMGVGLRSAAMAEEAKTGKLCCLPVFVVASTRASASTLKRPASGNSRVAEIYVPQLSLVRPPHSYLLFR